MTLTRGAKRLATIGLGLALTCCALALAAPPGQGRVPLVPSKQRAFRIPFNIEPRDRPRYKQVQLWVSSDGGLDWGKKPVDTTTPDNPFFTFKAPRDGEYWFAVRTLDTSNRLFPADDQDIEPNMKVLVDTLLPQLSLEGLPRRGSVASIRWEITEDRLDLGSFQIEYQAVGASDWSQVNVRKPGRTGRETWDAGTAEPLKVRMSVADRVGNVRVVALNLPDGIPNPGGNGEPADPNIPPPRGTFASSESERERGSPSPILSGPPPMPGVGAGSAPVSEPNPAVSGSHDPFASTNPVSDRVPSGGPASETSSPPIQVTSPKFGLRYDVEDAGPNGPAAVELFVTTDGGRTWYSRGEDPDRTSPFPVDLGGEGTFGLKLVAKSAANQGDLPPIPGEPPKTIVEVDGTGPNVKLEPVRIVGSKAVITWQASDPHPTPRSVLISVRPDVPDARWQPITPSPIDNNGQFTWNLPASCPPKVHFRVDVVDALGNKGFAETTETGPVLVDRSKPRGRILGLDPGLREGKAPTPRPYQ